MSAFSTPATTVARAQLRGRGRPFREILFGIAIRATLFISIGFLIMLLVYMVVNGWSRLDSRLWTEFPSKRLPEISGAKSAIYGTVWMMALTALFTIPVGVAAAVYLEEYADNERWYNRLIELNIQNLAGIPSIVYGILGLGIIARGFGLGFGIRTGALTLSLLVLPVVIIASREAIRSVPSTIRDGSLALGATQLQTIWRQVLPASVPGIATGAILALSRAIGEAAPLLMLGAFTQVLFTPSGWTDSYTVLPIQIYNWVTQSRTEFHDLAAAAIIILLLLLILMNSVAVWLRNRYQKRW